MRTTLTLPDDLHAMVSSMARDRHETVSRTVATLLRTALRGDQQGDRLSRDPVTGFTVIRLDRPITEEDVRALEDVE